MFGLRLIEASALPWMTISMLGFPRTEHLLSEAKNVLPGTKNILPGIKNLAKNVLPGTKNILPGTKNLPPRTPPKKQSWMQCPKVVADFPGLAYVYPLKEFIVVKVRDTLHDVIGSKGIAYTIFNRDGEKVFLAVQEKRCMKYKVTIFNYYGNEVILVKKPWNLCLHKARVWAPPGNYVGSIQEVRSCINTYKVMNKEGNTVLNIIARGFNHFVYRILSGEEEVGTVKKNWGFAAVLSVTNFGMSFPEGTAVGDKAVLLGALFLIGSLKY